MHPCRQCTLRGYPLSLNIKAFTWLRDSHGLYDYESLHVVRNTLRAESEGTIGRVADDIRVLTPAELAAPDKDVPAKTRLQRLASILVRDGTLKRMTRVGKFYVKDCSEGSVYDSQLDKLWLVVRSLKIMSPKKELYLRLGDVIKLGRAAFRVRDYRAEGVPAELAKTEEPPIDLGESKCAPKSAFGCNLRDCRAPGELCRICHSEDYSAENPLLSICKCTGTMRFVHYKCLKTWLDYKLTVRKQGYMCSYYWKTFECEICKQSYPCIKRVIRNL